MTETEAEIETDTDRELDSASFPPSMSSPPEPIKTKATTDLPAESNLSSFEQDSDGQTLRQGNNTTDTEDRHSRGRTQNQTPSPKTLPVASPPFWAARNSQDSPAAYGRTAPSASAESLTLAGLGITMQDNENSSIDERGSACWAKSVEVNSYVIVNSSATNIGAFVVWNIRVETLNGSSMDIRKRYSEFDDLRWRLMRTFPGFEAAVPELPPKSLISKFRPKFLEKRRAGLQYFLHCIMLNPEFSGSPILKEFLFS